MIAHASDMEESEGCDDVKAASHVKLTLGSYQQLPAIRAESLPT